jgi:uncharacterized protein
MYNKRMKIEYDHAKNKTNLAKHGVSFDEAKPALLDPLGWTGEDIKASGEHRYITLGMGSQGRLLVVVWTPRGENARIISAWKANPQQRQNYEQES